MSNNVLDHIVVCTRQAIAERKQAVPPADIEARARRAPVPRDFATALHGDGMKLIAEVKRASPSRGALVTDLDVARLARQYAEGGAAAISVLTERDFFKGSLDDLDVARQAVTLPVLRKDFIIDGYQVCEARAHGADAILLIAAILSPDQLSDLLALATSLGMAALVEVHSAAELQMALSAQARVIGINNRNLSDFTVDLETTRRLRPLIPEHVTVVSESGIHTPDDVVRLRMAGVDAILVGEALVTSSGPAARIRQLLAGARSFERKPGWKPCRRPLESIGI